MPLLCNVFTIYLLGYDIHIQTRTHARTHARAISANELIVKIKKL